MIALPTSIIVASISLLVAMAFLDPLSLIARFGIWKILTVVFALLNLKNVPLVWHVCTLLRTPQGLNLAHQTLASSLQCLYHTSLDLTSSYSHALNPFSLVPTLYHQDPKQPDGLRLQHPQIQQHLLYGP